MTGSVNTFMLHCVISCVSFHILGEDLWVLAVGNMAREHVPLRPLVKYVGNMHGNEVNASCVSYYFSVNMF